MILAFLIAFTILLIAVYAQIKKRELHVNLPYSKYLSQLPVVGSGLHFVFQQHDTLLKFYLSAPQETPYKYHVLYKTFVYIQRPEDFQVVLSSSKALRKSFNYRVLRIFLGKGLLTAPVSLWKKNRKLLEPAFHQKNLDHFVESFSKGATVFTQIVEKLNGKTFDLNTPVFKYNLEVLLKNGMDLAINIQTENHKLAEVLEESRQILMQRIMNILLLNDFLFGFTKSFKILNECVQYYQCFYSQVLENKKKQNLEENFNENSPCNILVDRLIWLQMFTDKITDNEALDELKTFIISGTDTTAVTICFILIMLAMHKDIEEKVYNEIIEVVGPERPIEYTDIPKLEYTDKVIKETLRLFPVGPLVLREVDEDIELESCTLKKGCTVVFGVGPIMRSAEYFPDPLKFDPERFNKEEVKKRHPYVYIPFFTGPRNCIGKNYAMMSMKTFVGTCVRKFRFETDFKRVEDIDFTISVLIKSLAGYPIRAIPRRPPNKANEENKT